MDRDTHTPEAGSVDFFGVKLKVNDPHLAALLNSSVTEDVQVIGVRARSAFSVDGRSAPEVVRRHESGSEVRDGSVVIRLDEDDT